MAVIEYYVEGYRGTPPLYHASFLKIQDARAKAISMIKSGKKKNVCVIEYANMPYWSMDYGQVYLKNGTFYFERYSDWDHYWSLRSNGSLKERYQR